MSMFGHDIILFWVRSYASLLLYFKFSIFNCLYAQSKYILYKEQKSVCMHQIYELIYCLFLAFRAFIGGALQEAFSCTDAYGSFLPDVSDEKFVCSHVSLYNKMPLSYLSKE